MKKKEDFNLWALKLKIGEIIKTIQRKKGEELVKVEDVEGVGGNVYSEDYLINIGNEEILYSTYYNEIYLGDGTKDNKKDLINILKFLENKLEEIKNEHSLFKSFLKKKIKNDIFK